MGLTNGLNCTHIEKKLMQNSFTAVLKLFCFSFISMCVRASGVIDIISSTHLVRCTTGNRHGPVLFLLYTADLSSVIESRCLRCHLYADDRQINGYCLPHATLELMETMSQGIDDVQSWMHANRLHS